MQHSESPTLWRVGKEEFKNAPISFVFPSARMEEVKDR
jgi:hypothetical protein